MGLTGFNLRRRKRALEKIKEEAKNAVRKPNVTVNEVAETVSVDDMTKDELLAFADEKGVEVTKQMKKSDIVEAIQKAMEG